MNDQKRVLVGGPWSPEHVAHRLAGVVRLGELPAELGGVHCNNRPIVTEFCARGGAREIRRQHYIRYHLRFEKTGKKKHVPDSQKTTRETGTTRNKHRREEDAGGTNQTNIALRVAPLRHAVATAAVNYSAYGRSSHSPPTQNTAYAKQQYPNNRAYRRWKNIKLTGWRQAIYVAGPFDAKNCNKISTHKKQSGKSHT